MASRRNSAEGGTAGTALSAGSGGNTGGGSGDYFDGVNTTLSFKSDWAAHGLLSYGIDNPGTAQNVVRWSDTGQTYSRGRGYFGFGTAFSNDQIMIHQQSAAGTPFYLAAKSTRKLWLYNAAGTAVWQGSVNLPVDLSRVRIEWRNHYMGTGTTDGTIEVGWWLDDDTTAQETSGLLTGNYGGGSTITNLRFGKYSSSSYTGKIRFDDLAYDTGTSAFTDWIGPAVTAYTASPADSAGITDSVSAVMTFIRDIADSVGITDTPGPQVMSIEIAQDDTAGATDAVGVVASVVRSVADAVGATDAATATAAMVRILGDPAGITDTAAAIVSATRQVGDAAGVTDAASVVVSAARTVADVAGITDSVTATIYLGATADDTAGATDAVEVTIAAYRSPAEAITASDAVATILSAQRQTDDQAGITDAATTALAAVRQIDDNAGITDDASVLMVSVRTISDGAAVTDTVIAVLGSDIPAEGGDVWAPRPPIRLVSPGAPIRTYAPRRRA